MEGRKEITADTVTRLVYQALKELELSEKEVRQAEEEISRISGEVRVDPALGEADRERMLAYIRQLTLLNDRQYRHLYKQGARDCVSLLRELGIIQ